MFHSLARIHKFEIVTLEVMPDHMHLLVNCTLQHYIPDILKALKGNTCGSCSKSSPSSRKSSGAGTSGTLHISWQVLVKTPKKQSKNYIGLQKKGRGSLLKLVEKAFRVRLYPTQGQQVQFNKTFGCSRWVYNHFLARRIKAYQTEKRTLNYNQCSAILTKLKEAPETKWLAEVDKFALQNSLRDLDAAFVNFFEGWAGFPKFKSKREPKQSYQTNFTNDNIRIDKERHLLRLPRVGWVKYAADGWEIPDNIVNTAVTRTPSGKYFASILCQVPVEPLQPADKEVGVDMGIKKFAILSTGEVIKNPKYYVKAQKKLARLQRALAKKKKGSKNREKARLKVARQHEKVANQRRDFQHKLSKRLVVENQVISMEDLRIKNMVKSQKLAKAISDAGWGEFQRMVEYKSAWYGRVFVKVDTFYPLSRLCKKCGTKNPMLTLSDREWQCLACGTIHDRDINAARNILAEGKRILAG